MPLACHVVITNTNEFIPIFNDTTTNANEFQTDIFYLKNKYNNPIMERSFEFFIRLRDLRP